MPSLNANYAPEDCNWCASSGIDQSAPSGTTTAYCPVCGGKGSVLVAQPPRKCAICQGTGRDSKESQFCNICGGSGWAHRASG